MSVTEIKILVQTENNERNKSKSWEVNKQKILPKIVGQCSTTILLSHMLIKMKFRLYYSVFYAK